nr:Swt1 family HEPN domain-containing protein [uncultured Butyrivibrio sp.]
MKDNYELVQRGFTILHPSIAGYIGMVMNQEYHSNWWNEVLDVLNDQRDLLYTGTYEELIDSLDIANCLRIIDRKWNEVFRDRLSINHRTWAKELMGVRNIVAHIGQQDLPKSDAERALDTMIRLCEAFDRESADDIRQLYETIRYSNGGNSGAKGPIPIDVPSGDVTSNKLIEGSSLLDMVGTDIVQKTNLTRKVTFAGKTEAYPVYKVRLDALYYNDQNDRIATWITRYRAENGVDALSKLKGDEYNDVIENFIFDSNPDAIQKTQRNISLVGQREPGVALADGRIVDGNRRYTCLRRIQRSSNKAEYFETVIMDVDIQTDKKQIKLLELAIQHGEEKKVDYDLIDYAIGTYMDVEKTKLLTIDEYANSTNETVNEVRKRIDIAEVICEFLDYLGLPEQFHIAREYQVYSLFQEMMPSIKQLKGTEKDVLKHIVFNNVLMRALLDQRKFIRDIKLLIKNGTYISYFDDQKSIDEEIHEKYDHYEVRSKEDIDRFARENEQITEEMQLALEKALLRSRRKQLIALPAENIGKSIALVSEIDPNMLDKMNAIEKESLKRSIKKLSNIVEEYDEKLGKDEDDFKRTTQATAIVEKIESLNEVYTLAEYAEEDLLVLCCDKKRKIETLSFSVGLKCVKELDSQSDVGEYKVFFVDENNKIVTNICEVMLNPSEESICRFVMDSHMSESKTAFLMIQKSTRNENQIDRKITYEVNVAFSADFDL